MQKGIRLNHNETLASHANRPAKKQSLPAFRGLAIASNSNLNIKPIVLIFAILIGLTLSLPSAPGVEASHLATTGIFSASDSTGLIDTFRWSGGVQTQFNGGFTTNDGFASGDVNGDREDEILIADDATGIITIFTQSGANLGSFNGNYALGDGFAAGDVTGNGVDDILIAKPGDDVAVFDQTGTEVAHPGGIYTDNDGFVTGDVTGDGVDEFLFANDVNGIVSVWGLGFSIAFHDLGFTQNDGFATGDFDGDGADEIIIANDATGFARIYNLAGDELASHYVEFTINDGFAVGDVNIDGLDEIVIADDSSTDITIWDHRGKPLTVFNSNFTINDGLAVESYRYPDVDGDGLLDIWENLGVDVDGDLVFEIRPSTLGANPNQADLFVELDCLVSDGNNNGVLTDAVDHSHCPRQDAIQDVVLAFANAPVTNPDGTQGIRLHVDAGPIYGGSFLVQGDGGVTGFYGDLGGGGDQIPEAGNEIIDWDGVPGRDGTNFYTLKQANFDPNRATIFRYGIFGHQTNMRQAINDCTGGVAEGIPGNDFLVTLGGLNGGGRPCWRSNNANGIDEDGDGLFDEDPIDGIDNDGDCPGDSNGDGLVCLRGDVGVDEDFGFSLGGRFQQAGTFMHELGHTLGLSHGGGDGINNKPNYLSVMSYTYGNCGIISRPANGLPGGCDFSRVKLNDLVETLPPGLDECQGLDNGFYGLGPVDWDNDGIFEGITNCQPPNNANVQADINGDSICVRPGPDGVLDTTPAGDDVIVGQTIRDGADRTCDTGATGDDRQARRVGSVQPAVLEGFDDWANIVYQFRTTPNFANGIATPVPDEPDPEIIEEAKKLLEERIEPVLTIGKASPATAFVGETIQYAISITNSGSGSAMDVRIVDTLPDGTQVVFEFDEIQAAADEILLVDFMVPLDTVPGTVLTNSVEVTYLDLLSNEKVASDSSDTTILNVVPSVDEPAVDIVPSDEGQSVVASATFSDSAGSLDAPFVCTVDYGDGPVAGTVNGNLCAGPVHVYPDNGSYSITVAVTDKYGDTGSNNASHQVNNVPPTVNSIEIPLDPVDITDQALHTVNVTFSDPAGANDEPYTCYFDLDYDGTTFDSDITASGISGNSCSTPLNYADPGVYKVKIKVIDKDGGVSLVEARQFIVVYDSDEGFVTGGGWINSPEGAFTADPLLTGKATFGFVSKYKKGRTVPEGNTEFQFHAADLNFHSGSYEWLVVTGGDYARYKGEGTINNALAPNSELYKFMLWAEDLDPGGDDTFRIRIWYEDETTGDEIDVYDNGFNQPINGGNIVVHSK